MVRKTRTQRIRQELFGNTTGTDDGAYRHDADYDIAAILERPDLGHPHGINDGS
jgi:hypothetical protein